MEFYRTKDHDTIRAWVEERQGIPVALVTDAEEEEDLLDIAFGPLPEGYQPVSWEEFFDMFDELNLTFSYAQETVPEELLYNFVSDEENPSDYLDDETQLPEVNEVGEENMHHQLREEDLY